MARLSMLLSKLYIKDLKGNLKKILGASFTRWRFVSHCNSIFLAVQNPPLERKRGISVRKQRQPFLSSIFPLPSEISLDSTSWAEKKFFNEQSARGGRVLSMQLGIWCLTFLSDKWHVSKAGKKTFC